MRGFPRSSMIALIAATLAVSATLTVPAAAQSVSDVQRAEFERIIRDYLLAHPEVLQEATNELEKRQAEADAVKHRESIKQYSQALFYSPRQVTIGNPQGDITLVEFFDYNCGFCKKALSDMIGLMQDDPKLRVVLKEFPVLGPGSVEAAKVAIAVRMQDPTGKKYLEFHQKLLGGRGPADRVHAIAAAKEVGLDVKRIEKDMASDEVNATIEESKQLAQSLDLGGTPSYVIGTNVVVGAVGLAALKEKIGTSRQ
jgi:protein-disulfide isomerase